MGKEGFAETVAEPWLGKAEMLGQGAGPTVRGKGPWCKALSSAAVVLSAGSPMQAEEVSSVTGPGCCCWLGLLTVPIGLPVLTAAPPQALRYSPISVTV